MRYLLFAGSNYYPGGGWDDFKGSFAELNLAIMKLANMNHYDWWHIVDTQNERVIAEGNIS